MGKIFFEGPLDAMYLLNYYARTINRVYLSLARGVFNDLRDIYHEAKSIDYTTIIPAESTFAVRCERAGSHEFTSLDVARVVGQAVIDSYYEATGRRLKVNLETPDVEIHVFIRDNDFLIGVNTTGEALHKRKYRVFDHPAALKTTLAAAMLRIAGYNGEPLLDPLCGGGTIVIEAAHKSRKTPIFLFRKEYLFSKLKIHDSLLEDLVKKKLLSEMNRDLYEITCMDISVKSIEGARRNAESALVLDTIKFKIGDAARIESYTGVEAELIVTNPPYGIRSHNLKKIEGFYKDLLKTWRDRYPGIKAVVITASTKQFENAVLATNVEIKSTRFVMHGGLPARIYLVKT